MKYRFFMTPMCPDCGEIKAFLRTLKLDGQIIDATTDEGIEIAQNYGVDSVPTMLFFNEKDEKVSEAKKLEEIKRVLENRSISSF